MLTFWVAAKLALGRFWNRYAVLALAIAGAVTVLVILTMLALARWADDIRAERNAWWRAEIARANAAVRAAVADGSAAARITDSDIIATLGATDDKLTSAEARVQRLSRLTAPPGARHDGGACPVVPRRCLELGDGLR